MEKITADTIAKMLTHPNPAYRKAVVARALIVVFKNQTKDERSLNQTTENNGIGFAGCDARSGTITAKYAIKHGTLLDWQYERWVKPSGKNQMPRICKYHKQINEAAKNRISKNGV